MPPNQTKGNTWDSVADQLRNSPQFAHSKARTPEGETYSGGMNSDVLQWAAAQKDLSQDVAETLVRIAHAMVGGYIEATQTELANRIGVRPDIFHGHMRTLRSRGHITQSLRHIWVAPSAPIKRSRNREVDWRKRDRILARDGSKCRVCGGTDRLCVDHIIAFSCGGTNADENLQILCTPCNLRKGNRSPAHFSALSIKAGIGGERSL